MEYQDLRLEKKARVAIVTLNAPAKINALTAAMRQSIVRVCADLAADDEVRAVVLTGAEKEFCGGTDYTAGGENSRNAGADAFIRLNKPVIAAINGDCLGEGLSLALSCDIRIASENAKFGVTQVTKGFVPDYGMTELLPFAVGLSNSFQLMFSGNVIGSEEAKELGIVSEIVPPEDLMGVVMDMAHRIANQPPHAVALTKKMVWRHRQEHIARALDLESTAQDICLNETDRKSRLDEFLKQ